MASAHSKQRPAIVHVPTSSTARKDEVEQMKEILALGKQASRSDGSMGPSLSAGHHQIMPSRNQLPLLVPRVLPLVPESELRGHPTNQQILHILLPTMVFV